MGATCSNCAAAAFLTTQLSLPPHLKSKSPFFNYKLRQTNGAKIVQRV
jgi:hypothetical protein